MGGLRLGLQDRYSFDQRRHQGLVQQASAEEETALKADGYKKVNWGKDLANYDDEYYKYLFWDYDYVKAPIYLWPLTPNILSSGGFENGYGFKNK